MSHAQVCLQDASYHRISTVQRTDSIIHYNSTVHLLELGCAA